MEPLYKDLSYEIVGAAFEVHNELGGGFLEKVYQEAFAIALQERGILFEREKRINISFHHHPLFTPYICDFCVENKIIVELYKRLTIITKLNSSITSKPQDYN